MATLELKVSPRNFNVSPEEPEEKQLVVQEDLLTIEELTYLESAPQHAAPHRVIEEPPGEMSQPVPSRLTAEGTEHSATLDLFLRLDLSKPPNFYMRTPDSARGLELVLSGRTDGQLMNIKLNVRYEGLPVGEALSYARFVRTLYREEGILYLSGQESEEERVELLDLPLPLDPAKRSEIEDRLRFLEALNEIGSATGTEFVYPSEADDEDLRNVNHVLKVLRSGWVALRVTNFTTPLPPETAKNLLDLIDREGEVAKTLTMTSEGERYKMFDVWVDLGPSMRYASGAHLQTPRAEIEEWLASSPEPDDSFDVLWVPVDDAPIHVFYQEWPKPSLEWVRQNLKAFEDEYGMPSEEFRRAWENGEPRVRNIEDGDIWISFLNAQETLQQRT